MDGNSILLVLIIVLSLIMVIVGALGLVNANKLRKMLAMDLEISLVGKTLHRTVSQAIEDNASARSPLLGDGTLVVPCIVFRRSGYWILQVVTSSEVTATRYYVRIV